jgi:hypothetical protein
MSEDLEGAACLSEGIVKARGAAADPDVALVIVEAGLAQASEDVYLLGEVIYARAIGGDGKGTSVFLRCGAIR